jgi:hypothetical protein
MPHGQREESLRQLSRLSGPDICSTHNIIFSIPFCLQSVLVHSGKCVKTCIQWHVEECSVALL